MELIHPMRTNGSGLVIAMTFLCSSIFAQSYLPLLNTSTNWQDEHGWANFGPNTANSECRRYYLDGDSIVDGNTYHILRQNGFTSYYAILISSMSTHWFSGEYVALLREDTAARKVYIRPPGWQVDWLLYDFSVGLGPYPDTYRFGSAPWLIVTAVDTVWLSDGPHRRLFFDQYHSIIEGIGSTRGFLDSELWGEVHVMQRLVCHTTADIPTYEINSTYCSCGSDVGIAQKLASTLRIGPSPTTDLCQVAGAMPNAPFLIRSMDGRLVLSGACSTSGSATIAMTDLPAGIYVLEIPEAKGRFTTKIIKQ